MHKILNAAGVPAAALQLIPDIVDSCRQCREWTKPQPRPIATSDIALEMNQKVETDLIFWKDFVIIHFVDRATRWQTASLVASRSTADLVGALDKSWVLNFGPMSLSLTASQR